MTFLFCVYNLSIYSRTDVKQMILNQLIKHLSRYCYVPVTRELFIVGMDCEVGDDVSWENIGVVENAFCVWVDFISIILSVRLKTAPSIRHKKIMPVWYSISMDTPFGRSKKIDYIHIFDVLYGSYTTIFLQLINWSIYILFLKLFIKLFTCMLKLIWLMKLCIYTCSRITVF